LIEESKDEIPALKKIIETQSTLIANQSAQIENLKLGNKISEE